MVGPAGLAIIIVSLGAGVGLLVSRALHWRAAGPIVLLVSAPLIPNVDLVGPLSADDILPIVGLALLVPAISRPRLTRSRLAQVALLSLAVATVARIASTFANAPDLENVSATFAVATLRPAFLAAAAIGVALVRPPERRGQLVAKSLAMLGAFEASLSLVMYAIPISGLTNRPARLFETLAGCDHRVTGTLGLSPNHIGAIFVLTIPMTVGLAIDAEGRRKWAWVAAAALQGAAVVLTFTRSSIGLALVASLVLLAYHGRARLLAMLAAGTFAVLFTVTSVACPPSTVSPGGGTGGPSAPTPMPVETLEPDTGGPTIVDRFTDPSDRAALWYTAARMTLDYPIAGVGIGRMIEVMRSDPDRYVDTPFGKSTSSAHNTILLAGAETGAVGAVSMAVLNAMIAIAALRLLWPRSRRPAIHTAAALAMIAFLAQGMLNNLFTVPATGTLLAVVAGAFAAFAIPPRGERPPEGPVAPGPTVPPSPPG